MNVSRDERKERKMVCAALWRYFRVLFRYQNATELVDEVYAEALCEALEKGKEIDFALAHRAIRRYATALGYREGPQGLHRREESMNQVNARGQSFTMEFADKRYPALRCVERSVQRMPRGKQLPAFPD